MTTIAELGVVVRTQGVQQAARDLDGFDRSANRAERAAGALAATAKRTLATLAATGAAYFGTRAILDNARAYENTTAKLRLYLQSQAELIKTQSQLFGIAQRAGLELSGVSDLYVKLSGASEALRNDQTKLLRVVELFSKGLVVSGADAAAAAASTRQFAQALASGTLRGDEFVSVMEGAPRVAKALADGLGVPIGKLRELAAEGELTSETVTEALLRGGRAIDAEFNRMPLTVDRAVQHVKNSFLQLIGQTNQASGATQELSKAIGGLASAMGDPQTIAAFQAMATGLANIAAKAFEAVGALREYYAENDRKGLVSLRKLRTELETQLFRAERRSGFGLGDANDPLGKLFGLPSGRQAEIAALRKELAEIDALITQHNRAAAEASRRFSPEYERASLNFNPNPKPQATLDTGEVTSRGSSGPSDASIQSARDRFNDMVGRFKSELEGPLERVEQNHLRNMREINQAAAAGRVSHEDLAKALEVEAQAYTKASKEVQNRLEAEVASLSGPVAQAENDHKAALRRIEELYASGAASGAQYNAMLAEEARAYGQAADAARRAADPIGAMLDDMRAQIDLIGRTSAEQAVMNELRRQGISLMGDEAQAALAVARSYEQQAMDKQRVIDLMDGFRQSGVDAFTDFVTGAKSAKDAFRDFMDSIAEQITRAIAEQWMTKLFGPMGSDGAGTSGGGILASLLGGLFGGGRAIGGPVSAGRVYQVNERGAPEIYTAGGKQFLLAPSDGRVTPATAAGGGRASQINQTFVVNGTPDRMTRQQMLRMAGSETSRAIRRG